MKSSREPELVRVVTTARLHMGFFDLNGGLGRRFGSIGLSLSQPRTSLQVSRAKGFEAEGANADRALACARNFAEKAGLTGGVRLMLDEAIPEHADRQTHLRTRPQAGMLRNRLVQH